jgi:hypothetical protein
VVPETFLQAHDGHLLMNVLRTQRNTGIGKYFYNSGLAAPTLYPASTHTACSRQYASFDVVPETLLQTHDEFQPAIRCEPLEIQA